MYREQIGLFIKEQKAKLYVPKSGGLNEYVNQLLRQIGVDEDGSFDRPGQSRGKLEIIAARGEDIGQRVDDCIARGDTTYGLTGDDLFDEYQIGNPNSPLVVLNTFDWFDASAQFNRPALCLMNQQGQLPKSPVTVSIAVNRKYELTSRTYLEDTFGKSGIEFSVVLYAGDTENTVAEGTHDWCVEIVYRGENSSESAISKMGIKIVEIVRFSDISLVGKETRNPWSEEYGRILKVAENPTDSGTSQLLSNNNEIAKKIGEECAEFVRAFTLGEGIPEELNGVIYAMMVAAAKQRIAWKDIEADLMARWK